MWGNDSHASRMFQNFFRNAAIRRGHYFLHYSTRVIQPVNCLFAVRFRPGGAS